MIIEERLKEVRDKFATFVNQDDKWKYLLKLARSYEGMDKSLRAEKFIINGCSTTMYLIPNYADGKIHFEMDVEGGNSNPLISRGLGVLAMKVFNDATPEEILSVDKTFFNEIGLDIGLSPTRSNGFASLLKQIYLYAQVYKSII